jgi:glycosyltransferase involved in cell wall biosynthesis
MVEDRPYVELEGEVPREELVERICTHRYGIHGKEYEHFGMAVAELAAGGAIPFVPASGGQHAIVGDDRLTFDSVEDAVDSIDRVLSNPATQTELRMGPAEIRERFGRERFKYEIRAIVAEEVDSSSSGAVDARGPVTNQRAGSDD